MSFKDEILSLRKKGMTYNQIVAAVGCSKAVVSYHCTSVGLQAPVQKPDVPIEQEEVVRWLLDDGVRSTDIADALNIPLRDITRFARSKNLVRNRTPGLSSYERVRRRRRHLKMLAVTSMGGCCTNCGYRKCFQALDFHHTEPEHKDFTISRNTNRAWTAIKEELAKCILLCANCYREHHALAGWDSTSEV